MKEFDFKDLDKEGLETLVAISKADAFNEWMYEVIAPFMEGNILEVGSGIGNISKYFINEGRTITLSDIRANYIQLLQTNFTGSPFIKGIINLDLVKDDFSNAYSGYASSFDSVFALNVIEHIKEDEQALINATSLLKPGGNMVILVPANQWMYNGLDKDLYHYRRYSLKDLRMKMEKAGLETTHSLFFNALGSAGWVFSGSLLKRKIISPGQMSAFNKMVPFARLIDRITHRFFGLSVVVVGKKPDN
jgi:SAM-dependent methyltransferase